MANSWLGHMRPGFAAHHIRHSSLVNTCPVGNLSVGQSRGVKFAHMPNLFFFQFGSAISNAHNIGLIASALLDHVLNVIALRSHEEMKRITARRIVTLVANQVVRRYLPIMKLVGYAVRAKVHSYMISHPIDAPITFAVCSASPKPALVGTALGEVVLKDLRQAEDVSGVMTLQELAGLSALVSASRDGRNRCLLAATAMTIAVWDFLGIGRSGIIDHVFSSFKATDHAEDVRASLGYFYWRPTRVIIPQEGL
jgi:hypothetical protein